jgi:hypothetical protein
MKIKIIITMAVAMLGIGLSIPSAFGGTTPNICGNGGTGYCLNDWNNGGSGSQVKMNYGHTPNSDFSFVSLSFMCHDGHVHANAPYGPCPFTNGSGLNTQMDGANIFALRHSNGLCVGTTSSDVNTIMTDCPDSYGNGGGWSTIYAEATNANCQSGPWFAESRYWSDAYTSLSSLQSGGNVGIQASIGVQNSTATCWGWVS